MPKYNPELLVSIIREIYNFGIFLDNEVLPYVAEDAVGYADAKRRATIQFYVDNVGLAGFITDGWHTGNDYDEFKTSAIVRPQKSVEGDLKSIQKLLLNIDPILNRASGSGDLSWENVRIVQSSLNNASSGLGSVYEGFFGKPIPVDYPRGRQMTVLSYETAPFVTSRQFEGVPAPPNISGVLAIAKAFFRPRNDTTFNDPFVNFIALFRDFASQLDASQPEPTKPLTPINVEQVGTSKLLEALGKLYTAQNNNFYVCITRSSEAASRSASILALLEQVDFKLILRSIYDSRTELKEARQGIKDLLGLPNEEEYERFYEGSVSTKALLDRMNAIHESENNALYEININTQEIKSYAEAIREDTIDIKTFIEELLIDKINQLQTNLYEVINTGYLSTLEDLERRFIALEARVDQQNFEVIRMLNVILTEVRS